jgi:peroxiredoxin
MARIGTTILDAGDQFPRLTFKLIDGTGLVVPDGLKTPWNVILFYRGSWCQYCIGQLKSFQSGVEQLAAEGIGVLAASVDPLEKAKEAQEFTRATFPIAYGLDVTTVAEAVGAFYDAKPAKAPAPHLQSTGFLLAPGGRVVVAAYSSGPIGRLAWQDVLGVVQKVKAARA